MTKQKQKQTLVNNQIQQIRNAHKALVSLKRGGLYLDHKQRAALHGISNDVHYTALYND